MHPAPELIDEIRAASRQMVRELGFMNETLANTQYSPSAVHSLIEIGERGPLTATQLAQRLGLEKSSVSRMLRKLILCGEIAETSTHSDARSKHLRLTGQGENTLAAIHRFARQRVRLALEKLPPSQQKTVGQGLTSYANALRSNTGDAPLPAENRFVITQGYRPGLVGRIVEMHANYYARQANFGQHFESLVARDMADLAARLNNPANQVWHVLDSEKIVGSIAIDGQSCGDNEALLRFFIIDDSARGHGLGRPLLAEAIAFCDAAGFSSIRLWTFKGLDAARKLYEEAGFTLHAEQQGEHWGSPVTEQCFVRHGAAT